MHDLIQFGQGPLNIKLEIEIGPKLDKAIQGDVDLGLVKEIAAQIVEKLTSRDFADLIMRSTGED